MPPPLVVAHRALAGPASGHGVLQPENALAGIEGALALGVDAIEVDVRRTRDGHLVLMHDATLRRTTGNARAVAEVDLAEVQMLSLLPRVVGVEPERVPTLDEAMRLIDGRCAIVLDFVDDEIADDLVATVRRFDAATWTWWTAHGPRLAQRLAETTPGSRSLLGWAYNEGFFATPADAIEGCVRRGLTGLNADHRYIDETAIRYAHREGVQVGVWTVNELRRMAALTHLGVDAITTDQPRTLQAVLARPNA
ncbi:MAG: hypothetical protein DWG77_04680 [Chloroflexi bacterium]|nr:hypothetical protein [Chloroflexota bacterium]